MHHHLQYLQSQLWQAWCEWGFHKEGLKMQWHCVCAMVKSRWEEATFALAAKLGSANCPQSAISVD